MNELKEALEALEKEKGISRVEVMKAIGDSLLIAANKHFEGCGEIISVEVDADKCEYHIFLEKEVVDEARDFDMEISLGNAKLIDEKYEIGDKVKVEQNSQDLSRIASQAAKNVLLQKIREAEKSLLCAQYADIARQVVTGIVQRQVGKNLSISLGKVDAILTESEMIKGEHYNTGDRIKVYILNVEAKTKGPRITVSRTHPELVRKLFEMEVTEIKDGVVEIKSIAREAGSRTKIAVYSNSPDVDAVGSCVGQNGARVNAIVEELGGEKIDIVDWDESPANLIQNALSPAKVIAVGADSDEKVAQVIVPDYQLSLAIGKEGQNARLAARLTGFKIDIKSETQAIEAGMYEQMEEGYYEDDEYYDEDGDSDSDE